MKGNYTLVVPSLAFTGPVNVAIDIGRAAHLSGWKVQIRYLSGNIDRNDLSFTDDVRKLRISDLWQAEGVVHTHCLRPDLLAYFFKYNHKVTLVSTIHNFFKDDLQYVKPSWQVLLSWHAWRGAMRRFDLAVCISNTMRTYYQELIPSQTFKLAYNFRSPADTGELEADTKSWLDEQKSKGRIVLSFVGALIHRKNIIALVDALQKAPSLSLIVCGTGPLEKELRTRVRLNCLEDRVRMEGHVSSPRTIVADTDALVLPSHTEGFPLAVLEAASVGVPALLSNITVHQELASLGFGIVFDHSTFFDFEKLACKLKEAYSSPSGAIQKLWYENFSARAGFSRYEYLIDECKTGFNI